MQSGKKNTFTRNDVFLISNLDENKLSISDTATLERFVNLGIINRDGSLTEFGIETRGRIKARIGKLQKGVSIACPEIPSLSFSAICDSVRHVNTARVKNKKLYFNEHFMLFGVPPKSLLAADVSGERMQHLVYWLRKLSKARKLNSGTIKAIEYRYVSGTNHGIVVLENNTQSVCVQYHYYLLLTHLRKDASLIVDSTNSTVVAVSSSDRKGFNGVIGAIMVFRQ